MAELYHKTETHKLNLEGKRTAIVIGINEYENSTKEYGNIPPLVGAENDAEELATRLQVYGDFEIKKGYNLLLGKNATCTAIRKAMSNIFWEEDNQYNLVLFYFSGHGFVDGYGNRYIAPYDIERNKPFIKGLNMTEITRTITDYCRSSTEIMKKKVVTILDCCHGESIVDKGDGDPGEGFVNGFQELKGEGRIIIASTDSDEKARENATCIDQNKKGEHPHGILTSHLLHALEGGREERLCGENGIILINDIMKFIKEEITGERQRIRFLVDGEGDILETEISVNLEQIKDSMPDLIEEARSYFNEPNMYALNTCTKIINKVLRWDTNNHEANILKGDIIQVLDCYRRKMPNWLTVNEPVLSAEFARYARGQRLYDKMLGLDTYLTFESLLKIEPIMLCLLHKLCGRIDDREVITEKGKRQSFIKECVSCIDDERKRWLRYRDIDIQ
jgi:hypothetical protein